MSKRERENERERERERERGEREVPRHSTHIGKNSHIKWLGTRIERNQCVCVCVCMHVFYLISDRSDPLGYDAW